MSNLEEMPQSQAQPQQQQRVPSRIIITFAEPNSVLLDVHYENATPLQVLAAGWVLQKSAEDAIDKMTKEEQAQREIKKIAVPSGFEKMIPKG